MISGEFNKGLAVAEITAAGLSATTSLPAFAGRGFDAGFPPRATPVIPLHPQAELPLLSFGERVGIELTALRLKSDALP